MKRIYDVLLKEHFRENRQMAFLSGPRQVGKTTTSQGTDNKRIYINWDKQSDRIGITKGADNIADHYRLNDLDIKWSTIIFDEIHKYSKWKNFLKGFFDAYGKDYKIIVTGSARLNIYKHGGDSLMGRYFNYRMHPLSVGEILSSKINETEISLPKKIDKSTIDQLLQFGGFPEPFLKGKTRFFNRWKRLRLEQFFNEDLRDLTNIHEIGQIEILAELLRNQSGQLVNYTSFSNNINVSVDTIRRWVTTLEYMYYSFVVKPWSSNIPKSLRKQPKIYLWDWSMISDTGPRYENFVASHLLKSVHFWTDIGLGDYGLYFLRDKLKREVDFLVTRNEKPWFIVEVKSSKNRNISGNLKYFSKLLNVENSFQISFDSEFIEKDCFSTKQPVKVPVSTLLSQLI